MPETKSYAMGKAHRLIGYLASFISASFFYLVWFIIETGPSRGGVTVLFTIGIGVFFWLFEGMAPALVLMVVPWYLAVIWHDRLRRFGLMYFSVVGAALTLALGCAASSLAPKPLFIEDQTFFEGFVIAAQRQGLCMLFTGLVFGFTFWLVSERSRRAPSVKP
jgi:hypothetical protein